MSNIIVKYVCSVVFSIVATEVNSTLVDFFYRYKQCPFFSIDTSGVHFFYRYKWTKFSCHSSHGPNFHRILVLDQNSMGEQINSTKNMAHGPFSMEKWSGGSCFHEKPVPGTCTSVLARSFLRGFPP